MNKTRRGNFFTLLMTGFAVALLFISGTVAYWIIVPAEGSNEKTSLLSGSGHNIRIMEMRLYSIDGSAQLCNDVSAMASLTEAFKKPRPDGFGGYYAPRIDLVFNSGSTYTTHAYIAKIDSNTYQIALPRNGFYSFPPYFYFLMNHGDLTYDAVVIDKDMRPVKDMIDKWNPRN